GAAVELLVEALDDRLIVDAGPGPLAVGAAQRYRPVGRAVLLPLHRVDEVGAAAAAQVQVAVLVVVQRGRRARVGSALLLEVDDLDDLARGQDDPAGVVTVIRLEAHDPRIGRWP